jgi:hypothetical protein
MTTPPIILYNVNNSNNGTWYVVDDGVMGGRSQGRLDLERGEVLHFHGKVSLENNGGFSSIRYDMASVTIAGKRMLRIKLKGDGKSYQFRVKKDRRERYSYITTFTTNGEWQDIEIDLRDMEPAFRGSMLNLPNFDFDIISEIGILIGNKKAETFSCFIQSIEVI